MRALRPSAGLSALRRRTAGPPRPFPAAFPVADGHVTAPRAAPLGGRWGGRGQPRSARGARREAQAAARTGPRRLNVSVCCIVPDGSLGHGEGRKAGLRELLVSPPPRSPSSDCAQPRDRAAAGRSHCRSRRGGGGHWEPSAGGGRFVCIRRAAASSSRSLSILIPLFAAPWRRVSSGELPALLSTHPPRPRGMVRAGGQRVSAARSHGTGRGGEPGAAVSGRGDGAGGEQGLGWAGLGLRELGAERGRARLCGKQPGGRGWARSAWLGL